MARCGSCNSLVLFGGMRDGDRTYCGPDCQERGELQALADTIPSDLLDEYVRRVHQGACPRCQGDGPVDVHTSYRVWSMIFVTTSNSLPRVSCRSCARKLQLGSLTFSFFLGWWGFPFGILMTPIQIGRNLWAMVGGPSASGPSELLVKTASLQMASEVPPESLPPGASWDTPWDSEDAP